MLEFRSSMDAMSWLKDKPIAYAQVLAVRGTLRTWPRIVASRSKELILQASRSLLVSATSWNYSPSQLPRSIVISALRDFRLYTGRELGDAVAAEHAVASINATIDVFRASKPDDAIDALGLSAPESARAIRTEARFENAYYTSHIADAVYAVLAEDADWLDKSRLEQHEATRILMTRPLWPGEMPHTLASTWNQARQFLTEKGDWDIWMDWYEQRLKGSDTAFTRLPIPQDEVTFSVIMENDSFWNRDPETVNADIKARLDAARLASNTTDDEALKTLPSIYDVKLVNGQLDARFVSADIANQDFGAQFHDTLRDLVDVAVEELENQQAPRLYRHMVERLRDNLAHPLGDLPFGKLMALQINLAAHAEAFGTGTLLPFQDSIRGTLTGLSDSLETLLGLSKSVQDAKASAYSLRINPADLPQLEVAYHGYLAAVTESGAGTAAYIEALNPDAEGNEDLNALAAEMANEPAILQAILRRRTERMGLNLVIVWNSLSILKKFAATYGYSLARIIDKEVTIGNLLAMLIPASVGVKSGLSPWVLWAIIASVPPFAVFKVVFRKLEESKAKESQK